MIRLWKHKRCVSGDKDGHGVSSDGQTVWNPKLLFASEAAGYSCPCAWSTSAPVLWEGSAAAPCREVWGWCRQDSFYPRPKREAQWGTGMWLHLQGTGAAFVAVAMLLSDNCNRVSVTQLLLHGLGLAEFWKAGNSVCSSEKWVTSTQFCLDPVCRWMWWQQRQMLLQEVEFSLDGT